MPPLPDWECNTTAKKQAMEQWVNDQLDKLPPNPRLLEPMSPDAIAQFAEYLGEEKPKLPQGRPERADPLKEFLVEDAKREIEAVKEIWKKHYDGKSNRGPMNRPTASEIVYRRFLALMGFPVNPKRLGMKEHPTEF